jgi:hypothetical protein
MLRNWTKTAAMLVASVVVAQSAALNAAVIWDTGNPVDSGFTTTFGNNPPGFAGFTPDSPSAGILTQATSLFNNARYVLPDATATAELSYTNGWFAEWRVNSTFNATNGNLHVNVLANDSFGGGLFGFFPTKVVYHNGSGLVDLATYASGFHTFRITRAPSGLNFQIQIDGAAPINIPNVAVFGTPSGRFHDGEGTGGDHRADTVPLGGNAQWDYVTINTLIPEPSSLVLFGIGAIGLIARRRRQR